MVTNKEVINIHCTVARNALLTFPFTFIYEIRQVNEIVEKTKRVGYLSGAYIKMLDRFISAANTMQKNKDSYLIESENKFMVNLLRS